VPLVGPSLLMGQRGPSAVMGPVGPSALSILPAGKIDRAKPISLSAALL